jgi:hypothetical protein
MLEIRSGLREYNKEKDALARLEANSQQVHSTSECRTARGRAITTQNTGRPSGVPIPEFAVAFDSFTAKRPEAIAQENAGQAGTDRRLALAVLSKSFSELQQAVAEDPEVFLSVAERLSEAIQRLEAQLGSARSAEARVLSVLSKLENQDPA